MASVVTGLARGVQTATAAASTAGVGNRVATVEEDARAPSAGALEMGPKSFDCTVSCMNTQPLGHGYNTCGQEAPQIFSLWNFGGVCMRIATASPPCNYHFRAQSRWN